MPIFDQATIARLKAHQADEHRHPLTCGRDRGDEPHRKYQAEHGGDLGQLEVNQDGLYCPVPGCYYRQTESPI